MRSILINWEPSNLFAWGIVGLHLFKEWGARADLAPVMRWPISEDEMLGLDRNHRDRVLAKVHASNEFSRRLQYTLTTAGEAVVKMAVVHALGNRFRTFPERVSGSLNVGRMVFEDTFLDSAAQLGTPCDVFICISEWNAELLREDVSVPVFTLHEGVDPSLYCPGTRSGRFGSDRFLIFSGGKLEFKKGQDLVMLAFKAFHARHPDSALVVAWQSIWPRLGDGFQGRLGAAIEADEMGRLRVSKWAADNGIDPSAVIDLGLVPNQQMPSILREVDCALVPSRCEGGTSMVAMEAMATGVPTVLAANTGLRDLIGDNNCIPLMRQRPCAPHPSEGRDGWCDSDVDEIVAALERLYASATLRRDVAAAGVAFMQARTWPAHAEGTLRCIVGDAART